MIDPLGHTTHSRTYSYGLKLINERQSLAGTATTSFYGFDGHGSVRFLTSSTGAVTDTYDYDAFGNLVSQTGTTPNTYLFSGEQFDSALGIYYHRARYYDQRQGRFWTMDTWEGGFLEPFSLHRYLYARSNPVDRVDPAGKADFSISANLTALSSAVTLAVTELQGTLVETFEEGGGAAVGSFFVALGQYTQESARSVIQLFARINTEQVYGEN